MSQCLNVYLSFCAVESSAEASTANVAKSYERLLQDKEKYIRDLKNRLDRSWAAGLNHFFKDAQNLIPNSEVHYMLDRATQVLQEEANVLEVSINQQQEAKEGEPKAREANEEMVVVGDTHGQFYDVLSLFELNGEPSETQKYIFNGDYVDRGSFSFQVIFLLLSYKVLYPKSVFLLRGNHETINMNIMYGFYHEILAKYDKSVMEKFWKVFSHLPIAAVFKNEVYPDYKAIVLHGGLFTKSDVTIDELNAIDRTTAAEGGAEERAEKEGRGEGEKTEKNDRFGLMQDLLWSDPMKGTGRKENESRGGGLLFGPDVTERFLERNGLSLLIRSHQVRKYGWSVEHSNKCITVFSSPNYCDSVNNKGAFLRFTKSKKTPDIVEFGAVKHPPLGPMAHLQIYRGKARL